MSEETRLELPRDLLRKIDGNRGNLTYEEFIEVCVSAWLGREKPPLGDASAELYITREEFEEFKTGIRNLLRSSFKFLLLYWMELYPETSEEQAGMKGRLLNVIAENS